MQATCPVEPEEGRCATRTGNYLLHGGGYQDQARAGSAACNRMGSPRWNNLRDTKDRSDLLFEKQTAADLIQIGRHSVPFNRDATRWLETWLGSRLSFAKHTRRCANKAKAAEGRLRSVVARYGIWMTASKRSRGSLAPVASSEAEGGSMPATAGLRRRQEAFAARLCSPPSESLRSERW